jgi:hypothetical protein
MPGSPKDHEIILQIMPVRRKTKGKGNRAVSARFRIWDRKRHLVSRPILLPAPNSRHPDFCLPLQLNLIEHSFNIESGGQHAQELIA